MSDLKEYLDNVKDDVKRGYLQFERMFYEAKYDIEASRHNANKYLEMPEEKMYRLMREFRQMKVVPFVDDCVCDEDTNAIGQDYNPVRIMDVYLKVVVFYRDEEDGRMIMLERPDQLFKYIYSYVDEKEQAELPQDEVTRMACNIMYNYEPEVIIAVHVG